MAFALGTGIATAARSISAVSRIFVFVNTVGMTIRRPGAIQYEIRTLYPPQ